MKEEFKLIGAILYQQQETAGFVKEVKELIKQGAPLEHDGLNALVWAVSKGFTKTAEALIDAGADVNGKDKTLWEGTPLVIGASNKKNLPIIQKLIDKGADVNIACVQGMTPLIWAAERGCLDIAVLLIEKGADINARARDGKTALNWAAFAGKKETAKLLIDKGANLGIMDAEGFTAIDRARKYSPKSGIADLISEAYGLEPFTPKRKKSSGPKPG